MITFVGSAEELIELSPEMNLASIWSKILEVFGTSVRAERHLAAFETVFYLVMFELTTHVDTVYIACAGTFKCLKIPTERRTESKAEEIPARITLVKRSEFIITVPGDIPSSSYNEILKLAECDTCMYKIEGHDICVYIGTCWKCPITVNITTNKIHHKEDKKL